jgi:hemerythrin-like domain-containing protein
MVEIIRQLREEHATMAQLLAMLERQIVRLGNGQPPDREVIRSLLKYCLTYPALCHHRKEDLVLSKLRERDVGLPLAVGRLEEDHEGLSRLTNRFLEVGHKVLQGEPASEQLFGLTGQDFVATYRDHMDMEENLFFPLALEALGADDWAAIDAQVANPDDPIFGERAKKQFDSLRNKIFALGDFGR